MDVFNKLYSSVTSTVSSLSGVLPGNPVTREFEATQFVATAGPGLLWKIYKGYKKSTKQEAAIFVLEKKSLERLPKGDRDALIDILKQGIIQLTKLRHPQILTVQHSLEESRESLAFATEPVFASLANILGSNGGAQQLPNHLNNYKLYDVEIKYGLMHIAEGLAFLHNDVKLLHHNICPESIIINQQGAWKIFGFDFCIANTAGPGVAPCWPFREYFPVNHALTQPSLDYLAPEQKTSNIYSAASDIYSLGMVIFTLYSTNHQTLGNIGDDYRRFSDFVQKDLRAVSGTKLLCVDEGVRDYVKLMLNYVPELRPDLHQFLKIPYFEDIGVKTLNYLDSLFQWDNLQKSQFYKGLPQIIQKLPHRISIYRILPSLTKEFVNPHMVPFVLPNVLLIAENSTREEYIKHILPVLKPVMTIQEPIQILLIFMQRMELILKLTPGEEVKSDVLPMLYRALESDAQQIQELCLSVLPTFASLIDYPAMKNALLPRIKKLCLTTNYISVRVNCLLCIGKLLEHLDKWLVLDEIIPLLPQIPSREPAVLMGILGIYKLAMSHKKIGITKEVMATKVLPFLIPLCVENGLTLNQFNALMTLVKQMIASVETEHRAKLEQLNSIKNESKGIESTLSGSDSLVAAPAPASDIDQMFSGLGVDTFDEPSKELPRLPEPTTGLSMSIEEKQRIANLQGSARRFASQPPLTSPPKPVNQPPPRPVDLTNTLLQSNLTQLTRSPQGNSNPMAYNNMTQPSNTNSMTYNSMTQPSNTKSTTYNTNSFSANSPLSPQSSYRPMASENSNPLLPNGQWDRSSNMNDKWMKQSDMQVKQDWSAFESLLPNQNQGNANSEKKLTSNEMMDFLS